MNFMKYVWKNNRPVFVSSTIMLLFILSICLTPIYGKSIFVFISSLFVIMLSYVLLFLLIDATYNNFKEIYFKYKIQQAEDAELIIRRLKEKQ